MLRATFIALLGLLLLTPNALLAATVQGSRTMVLSEEPEGNAYLLAGDLTVAAPVTGDLHAIGGGIVTSAPVSGDGMLIGGSVDIRKAVAGDLRVFGARVTIDDQVGGDLIAGGSTVTVHATPSFAWIGGVQVLMDKGARGDVTVYGSTVTLGGTFDGDVSVTSSDRIVLTSGTVIKGTLSYDAPQQLEIPKDVTVGKVVYTGQTYLPTSEEAHTFALAGLALFFFVRILAAVIAAGLFAGVFPTFAQAVADRTLSFSINRFFLLTLLGFAVLVAVPVLVLLLLLSFAGAILALILLASYVLLLLLAYLYAAVIAGAALSRSIVKRSVFLWRDAVFGMLALSIVGLIPYLGWVVLFVFVATAAGAIVSFFYKLAFMQESDELSFE
jgi:hypothetical protein